MPIKVGKRLVEQYASTLTTNTHTNTNTKGNVKNMGSNFSEIRPMQGITVIEKGK